MRWLLGIWRGGAVDKWWERAEATRRRGYIAAMPVLLSETRATEMRVPPIYGVV